VKDISKLGRKPVCLFKLSLAFETHFVKSYSTVRDDVINQSNSDKQ